MLGCGVEVNTKENKDFSGFDLSSLRWNKVVICTDGDVDGFQIRTLILAMLYRLTPQLIEQGYVYIAESPLYEINTKDKVYFAYSETEKGRPRGTGQNEIYPAASKGLGDKQPDKIDAHTMNPAPAF